MNQLFFKKQKNNNLFNTKFLLSLFIYYFFALAYFQVTREILRE